MKPIVLEHPLIEHKLSVLRDKNTPTGVFRKIIREISIILCYEATIKKMKTHHLNEDNYVFVPILRAGLGMLDGAVSVLQGARVGHIGMYRDEKTFEPVNYFFKVPDKIEEKEVIILDPMLATGGSACDAIELLKSRGVKKIKFLCIIAAPEGLKRVSKDHPDVEIYAACCDEKLNKNKYIVPGLGDAGDRIYGTK